MKKLFYCFPIVLLFVVQLVAAESILRFDKRNVECEDKWVVMQMNKDSIYTYGFIYIDQDAGLTFNYEGKFIISEKGQFQKINDNLTSFKVRLEPNNKALALIPQSQMKELGITAYPEWLKAYKSDTSSAKYYYSQGFRYNGWGLCDKALEYLLNAEKMDKNYPGLNVEIAFSFNCIGKYEKAVSYLKNALMLTPGDAYVNKELIYAQVKQGNLDDASESCKRAIAVCVDSQYNAENCYNLLYMYFKKKDKANFDTWKSETKKWLKKDSRLIQSIEAMEKEMSNVSGK